MEIVRIRFLPDDVTVEAEIGQLLLDVALEAGVFIPAACGGSGACGQCKVKMVEGSVEVLQIERVRADARAEGYVLACQSRVAGDAVVEVPKAKVGRKVIPRDEAERMRLTAKPMESPIIPEMNPMALRVFMEPPAPSPEDNLSDYERIVRTLKTEHDVFPVSASLDILRELPLHVRQENWKITACFEVEDVPCPNANTRIYRLGGVVPGHLREPATAIAIDIGTTSLWGELVSLETGEVLARASRYNPQISMGDDVISRIVFALKKDGLEKLQQHVIKGLDEIIDETLQKTGMSRDNISYLVAAGNTVMTHLFLGLYPKYLREAPYVPAAHSVQAIPASQLGLNLPSHYRLYVLHDDRFDVDVGVDTKRFSAAVHVVISQL